MFLEHLRVAMVAATLELLVAPAEADLQQELQTLVPPQLRQLVDLKGAEKALTEELAGAVAMVPFRLHIAEHKLIRSRSTVAVVIIPETKRTRPLRI